MINIRSLALGLSGLLLLDSCKDPFSTTAERLIEDGKVQTFTDTFSVTGTTVFEDPLRTDGLASTSNLLVGNLEDPVFGNSFASINMQLKLPIVYFLTRMLVEKKYLQFIKSALRIGFLEKKLFLLFKTLVT